MRLDIGFLARDLCPWCIDDSTDADHIVVPDDVVLLADEYEDYGTGGTIIELHIEAGTILPFEDATFEEVFAGRSMCGIIDGMSKKEINGVLREIARVMKVGASIKIIDNADDVAKILEVWTGMLDVPEVCIGPNMCVYDWNEDSYCELEVQTRRIPYNR